VGFTASLLTVVAQLLASTGVAVWKPTGAYTDSEVGIVLGVPTQSPPAQVALAAYGTSDDPALSDSVVQMQVRMRAAGADVRKVDDLADTVFDALQGLRGATVGSGRLVYARRHSTLPLGVDGNGRFERTDNYTLTVHRPSTHRE